MKAPRHFETARLILSAPSEDDAVAIFERYSSDPDVTRFVGWPRHRSLDETRAFLQFSAEEWERWPAGPYIIHSRGDGRLLGGTGFSFETSQSAATGYVLAKDAWGQGFATEALTAVIEIARHIRLERLSALCHPEHRASWRVLEKCGFTRDATYSHRTEFPNLAPGVPQSVFCYTMTLGFHV